MSCAAPGEGGAPCGGRHLLALHGWFVLGEWTSCTASAEGGVHRGVLKGGLFPQTPPPDTKAEAWERELEVRVKRLTSAIRRLENMGSHPPPRVQTRHEVRLMPPSVSSSKEEFLVISRSASSFNKVSRLSDEEEGAPGQHEDLTTSSTAQSRAVSAAGGQRRSPRHRQPGQVPQHEAKQQQPG